MLHCHVSTISIAVGHFAVCTLLGCTVSLNIGPAVSQLGSTLVDEEIVAHDIDYSDPLLAQRKIIVSEDLNSGTGKRLIARLLYLEQQAPGQPIDLYLDSDGGSGSVAFAVIDTMRTMRSPVNTYAWSNPGSSAALILAAGTGRRYATSHSSIWIHGLRFTGNPHSELRDQITGLYYSLWHEIAALPDEWFPMSPDVMHALDADMALRYRVVDEIIDTTLQSNPPAQATPPSVVP